MIFKKILHFNWSIATKFRLTSLFTLKIRSTALKVEKNTVYKNERK